MILLLGGTSDAREIARTLRAAGHRVVLTTVTDYGAELAEGDAEVRVGALDADGFAALLDGVSLVVDATHPFAAVVSQIAITECAAHGVPYLRFERAGSDLPSGVHLATAVEDAAQQAVALAAGGTIFLTVGSKTLPTYLAAARDAGCRVVARVLPTANVLAECERLGMSPADILGMQGPTTSEVDAVLLRFYHAAVLVTKESGPQGGVEEKLAAAAQVGVPVVVVGRPRVDYPAVVDSVEGLLAMVAGYVPGDH